MPPHFWQDLEPYRWVILLAFVDPLVVAIGLWVGWKADQGAKLLLAGLAAPIAAVAVSFLLRFVGVSWFEGGYYFGGAHALARFFAGVLWAVIGYGARRAKARATERP